MSDVKITVTTELGSIVSLETSREVALAVLAEFAAAAEGAAQQVRVALSGAVDPGPATRDGVVRALQRGLNELGYQPPLTVDGEYGPKTQEAVRRIFGWFS